MCALPSAAVPVMLALNYHVYESEAASTMLLTTLAMIVAPCDCMGGGLRPSHAVNPAETA
jgi:hypothetical protein